MIKTCKGDCGRTLPLGDFPKSGFYKGQQQYYAKCKECKRLVEREYRASNKDKVSLKNKKWRAKNVEKTIANSARWHEENREHSREASRRWKQENPDRVKETNQNRRALLMERTRCEVARGYWNIMRSFYGSQCMSPECDATENLTLDHVVPLSKEGWHEFANWQILCKPCNSGKRDWHSEDYRPWPKLIDTKGYVKDLDRTGVVRVIEDPRDLFS